MATLAGVKLQTPALTAQSERWLFSARLDLSAFLGSAVLSLLLLLIGAHLGLLDGDTPDWAWIPAVLLVDVAHVYATGFRTYFKPTEVRRRPWLYVLVPVLGYFLGVTLYSEGALWFWRALAYLAVFHFVRQQYGWVALYRSRLGERDRFSYWLDTVTIYAATVYPLLYWHAHLPRNFWWFLPNDFAPLIPLNLLTGLTVIYWLLMAAYAGRALYCWLVARRPNPGKDIVVVTTAACWYLGIVAFNSDYAFTVTNVLIHGIPYLLLVYWYERHHSDAEGGHWLQRSLSHKLILFLGLLWVMAYVEELFWDRAVWQERTWLFGLPWQLEAWKMWLVPLLAVPQLTHYVLDGFLWRRRATPELFQAK